MSDRYALQFSLFRSLVRSRRFEDGTLRFLESILVSNDVKSFLELRSSVKEFMRSESLIIIHEIAEKPVDYQLSALDFLVRSFAMTGDVESCLALRYEALILRELNSACYQWLQVSYSEWLSFAEDALKSNFYPIAGKAYENALSRLRENGTVSSEAADVENVLVIEETMRLKDVAAEVAAPRSVQAQASQYLKRKRTLKKERDSSLGKQAQSYASTLFRIGMKKRNIRKLEECQSLDQVPQTL